MTLTAIRTFTRHDLDPAMVKQSIDNKIATIERHRATALKEHAEKVAFYNAAKHAGRRWTHDNPAPSSDGIDAGFDRQVERERNYYSTVRVIERHNTDANDSCYLLAYGDQPDSECIIGTGPFDSLDIAIQWFKKGYR